MMRPITWALVLSGLLLCDAALAAKRDLDAERIEQALARLETDPALGSLAPYELALAREAGRVLAATRGGNAAQRAHLVYLADRRVDIAYAAANAALEQQKLAQLEREHSQILLEAAQHEADRARRESEILRVQSLARAEEAERMRAEAEAAASEKEASEREASHARAEAEQSRRVAAAQAEEASLAKKEADLARAAADSLRAQMGELSAHQDARGEVMTLGDSVFGSGRTTIAPAALANLGPVVEFANKDTRRSLRIEGHTDNRGGENLNQVLSQKRAEAVRDALIARGVSAARISAVGLGAGHPVDDNGTDAGRARNRRVEIILVEPK